MNRFIYLALVVSINWCCKSGSDCCIPPNPPGDSSFIKGADVSWLTEMEAAGRKFYNSAGTEKECMGILKDLGMNAIRLRVWVEPTNWWNNSTDVLNKAIRAKNLGMKVMLDLHYSDTWADPGHQTKPAAWTTSDIKGLVEAVANHTRLMLVALKGMGIKPDWVQVGNETNDGMLWPEGKASTNMANFAQLVRAGYDAVKAFDSSIKVIVHISNGYDNALFRWIFDGLKNNGAEWDVIGLSLYPAATNWSTMNSQCLANMEDIVARYGKPVMVVEVGMSWDQADACRSFLSDLISKVKSVSNKKGLGVFYWEPQAYNNWQGYTLGAFDNTGKPTVALNAFK